MDTVNSYDIIIALIKACQDESAEYKFVDGPGGYTGQLGAFITF